jgi:hypothetical protein
MASKDPPKHKDDKDEKASARAGERSSRPGAVSVPAGQQAELLDQRIAEKTASAATGATSVGATLESIDAKIAAKIRDGDAKPGACQEMHQLDSAIQAKMTSNSNASDAAAKQGARASAAVPSRPGAYAATPLPNHAVDALQGLEADVQAKQRARVGAVAESSLDAKIASKMRGDVQPERSFNSGSSVASDVSSKNAARGSRTAPAQPGAFASTEASSVKATGLDDLESRIAAKMAPVEARNELNALEDSIQAKIRGHDAKAHSSSTVDLETKVQGKMAGGAAAAAAAAAPRAQLENFEDAVQAKMRSNGPPRAASAESTMPSTYHQLHTMETSLQAKLGADSAKGKSMDAPQNPATAHALQSLEASIQSKMNSANATAAASPDTLSNFESQIMDKQRLGRGTGGERDASPLDMQSAPDSSLQKPSVGNVAHESSMFTKDDASESKGHHNDLLYKADDQDLEYGEYGGPDENGLAVAFAVEEEEDAYIPSAIEYDPDAKPPMYRNRRFRLYATMAMLVVAVGTAGILAGILLGRSSATPLPLPERATLGIREYVERLVGSEPMLDATNPYREALDWIQDVDPLALTPQDKGFAQRFLAAYLYFSTTVQGPWNNDCDPAQEGETDDTVYRYTGVIDVTLEYTLDAKRWLSKHDSCLWCAVECDSAGQIIKIDFGTLPSWSWRGRTRRAHLSLSFVFVRSRA